MTITGTTSFDLSFLEVAEEAYERAGREMRSGYDLKTARRSFNLMMLDWQNRGINMWTMEQGTITLVQGQSTYALPSDTIDLMDHVVRTNANIPNNQSDINITRISMPTYITIPNKNTQARPIQVLVQRMSSEIQITTITVGVNIAPTDTVITLSSTVGLAAAGFLNIGSETIYYDYIVGNILNGCARGQNNTIAASATIGTAVFINWIPCVTVWPTPDASTTYTFVYWRIRRIQDSVGANTNDMTARFLPVATAGLAYHLAMKNPNDTLFSLQKLQQLKIAYEEAFELASGEDREKAAIRFVPRRSYISGGNT